MIGFQSSCKRELQMKHRAIFLSLNLDILAQTGEKLNWLLLLDLINHKHGFDALKKKQPGRYNKDDICSLFGEEIVKKGYIVLLLNNKVPYCLENVSWQGDELGS